MTYLQTEKEKEKIDVIITNSEKSLGFIEFWEIGIGIIQIAILFLLIKIVR